MKIKRSVFYLLLPLFLIIAFNIGFILLNLKGPSAYFWYIRKALQDCFVGIPLILLVCFLVILSLFSFIKKKSKQQIILINIITLLLYFVSLNLSIFPRLNHISGSKNKNLLVLKKTPSLQEAVLSSNASYARAIEKYSEIDQMFEGSYFVIPFSDRANKYFYFIVYLNRKQILTKEYHYVLSDQEYADIIKYSHKVIRVLNLSREYETYLVFNDNEATKEVYVFFNGERCLLVPFSLAKKYL